MYLMTMSPSRCVGCILLLLYWTPNVVPSFSILPGSCLQLLQMLFHVFWKGVSICLINTQTPLSSHWLSHVSLVLSPSSACTVCRVDLCRVSCGKGFCMSYPPAPFCLFSIHRSELPLIFYCHWKNHMERVHWTSRSILFDCKSQSCISTPVCLICSSSARARHFGLNGRCSLMNTFIPSIVSLQRLPLLFMNLFSI